MGSLTITIPLKINRSFKVEDKKFAKRLVEELENFGEQTSAFDEVLGIWASRPESENDLLETLRSRNNRRDG